MMQYAKAMIKAGEGSSSEKNAKLEAIRKILSKKVVVSTITYKINSIK